jgi:Leucine-rich repeat (LRR) protein
MLLRINLKVLNLRNNNIKDFNEIAKLIVNSRILRSIDLRGNIISTIEQMDDIIGALS